MPPVPVRLCLVLGLLSVMEPLSAQDAHRIWGSVRTTDGHVYEGFLRWDRNEVSWVDVLDGAKEVPAENYQIWLAADSTREQPTRTLEVKGYRVSWDEEDPEFPAVAASGVRFGHLSSLIPSGDDAAEIVFRSGAHLQLTGGRTDIGVSMREFLIDTPGEDAVELDWGDIERIDFSAAPQGARAASPRLYGTVEDDLGRTFTGFVSWDLDEVFQSDILDGRDEDREDRDIPFKDIRSIEGERRSATVTLASGRSVVLSGTNDVNRGNRGIQISDPGLGMVEVEWDEFRRLTLQPVPAVPGYDAFDGGGPLVGTLRTQSGEEIHGRIRWDADEESSWEFLNGSSEDVTFSIEFGQITSIERGELVGVRVTLLDGRSFDLEDSNDVDWENKGILIAPTTAEAEGATAAAAWRYIPWDDFQALRFDHAPTADRSGRSGW